MTIYVAEIKGRGIAAFDAGTSPDAQCLVRDRLFRGDLMELTSDGLPIWDGLGDIDVRQAFPGEEARWRTSRAKAIRRGDIEAGDDTWVAFLIALTDPGRRGRRARK